jgi:hypothetical protein
MRVQYALLPMALVGMIAGTAFAQQGGQAVQLPTFSMFTVNTTVSVPDQGCTYLGGIKRAAEGRNEFGVPMLGKLPFAGRLFKNVGIGRDVSAGNMHVTARIIIPEEEEAKLGILPSTGSLSNITMPRGQAAMLARQVLPRDPHRGSSWTVEPKPQPTMSLAEAQSQRAAQKETRVDEATKFFARGQKAEAEGKANVAKIYYQMAARRATGPLKDQVLAKLDAIGRVQTGSAVVRRTE